MWVLPIQCVCLCRCCQLSVLLCTGVVDSLSWTQLVLPTQIVGLCRVAGRICWLGRVLTNKFAGLCDCCRPNVFVCVGVDDLVRSPVLVWPIQCVGLCRC